MKRVRFSDPAGTVRAGEWTPSGIELPGKTYAPEDIAVLPPVEPEKVIGVTPNHGSQFEGTGRPAMDIFLKPRNTLVGHDRRVELPLSESPINFEAELGVVIGTHCSDVSAADAMAVVDGFTCINDLTNMGRDTLNKQKAFDRATPIGPVVVDPAAVSSDATIEMYVNGERRQRFDRTAYVRSVRDVVAEVSSLIALEPGDVITMGTATGVGRLSDGDETEVRIDGIGTLRTRFVAG